MVDRNALKRTLRLRAGDTSRDDDLDAVIAAAIDHIQKATGRYFGEDGASMTEYLTGNGTVTLFLKEAPSTADDATITITEKEYPNSAGTVIEADDDEGYIVRGRKVLRCGGAVWDKGFEYQVEYDVAATAAPDDVLQAVLALAAYFWRTNQAPGVRSESISGHSYTIASIDEVPGLAAVIGHYRRVRVA